MGVPQWAYTMTTKTPGATRSCVSNRNVRIAGARRRKTTHNNPAPLFLKT